VAAAACRRVRNLTTDAGLPTWLADAVAGIAHLHNITLTD
jgi:hypothetical protein